MCKRVTCRNCSKPTYAGCGKHIEQVLGDVAVEDRCSCSSNEKAASGGGFLSRLLGR